MRRAAAGRIYRGMALPVYIDDDLIATIAAEVKTSRPTVLRRLAGMHLGGPAAYAIDRALADRGIIRAHVARDAEVRS